VVVGSPPEERGVVASASYEARKYGIRSAMPMSQALRLCPELVRIDRDIGYYQSLSERVMALLGEYAQELEVVSIDEAYLKVSDETSALETAWAIRERVRKEVGLGLSVGIGSNKLLAKVACGRAKPDGVLEVRAGEEADFLAPLAVEELPGVGPSTAQQLAEYGIHTIGELAQAPEEWLRTVLGPAQGTSLHLKAWGQGSTKLGRGDLPKSISRETTFPEDVADPRQLEAVLRELSYEVGEALQRQRLMARVVDMKLRYEDFETVSRQTTLALPTDRREEIYRLALELLREELKGQSRWVRLIGVGVSKIKRLARQLALFGDPRHRAIESQVEPLKRKYGNGVLRKGGAGEAREAPGGKK